LMAVRPSTQPVDVPHRRTHKQSVKGHVYIPNSYRRLWSIKCSACKIRQGRRLTSLFVARCYASAAYAVMRCPSVHPSVCPSVTFVDSVETNKIIFIFFHRRVATHHSSFFLIKRQGNILTETLNGELNAGG